MYSKTIIIGHVGSTPKAKPSNSGTNVTSFPVAVDSYSGKDKEKKTEWFNVVCFGKIADLCVKFLDKGSVVAVDGTVQLRSYTSQKDGTTKYSLDLVANNVTFLSSKKQDSGAPSKQSTQKHQQESVFEDMDDVPF